MCHHETAVNCSATSNTETSDNKPLLSLSLGPDKHLNINKKNNNIHHDKNKNQNKKKETLKDKKQSKQKQHNSGGKSTRNFVKNSSKNSLKSNVSSKKSVKNSVSVKTIDNAVKVIKTNFIVDKDVEDDSFRFKREKLTELKLTTPAPPNMNVINKVKGNKRKWKDGKSNVNLKKSRKSSSKKKLSNPINDVNLHDDDDVEEAIKAVKLEHNDIIHNCTQDTLCKSHKLRKEEIRKNIKLPPNQKDNKQLKKNKKKSKNKDPISKSAANEDARSSEERLSNSLNVKTEKSSLLIPESLGDDTIKLSEQPVVLHNPIKSDSDKIRNTTCQNDPVPISNHSSEQNVPATRKQNFSFRTKPLDKLPFSRVIAAQKKSDGEFSPYIPFPRLLANLTKSSRSVRIVPVKYFYIQLIQ